MFIIFKIEIITWNQWTVNELFPLDKNTWNYTTVYKSSVSRIVIEVIIVFKWILSLVIWNSITD